MQSTQMGDRLVAKQAQDASVCRRLLPSSCAAVAVLLALLGAGCSGPSPDTGAAFPPTGDEADLTSPPVLVLPGDGALLSEARPLFRWQAESGHSRALLQICADAACTTEQQSFASSTDAGAHAPSDLAEGPHYVRMAWLRGVERASTWSPASRFVISSKPPVITADLFGVWSAASDDVWAVGAAGTILHYSGTWSVEPSPTTMALRSVWTAGRGWTWAVGEAGTILRRNGNHWTTTASPTTNSLTGVWASAPSDAWAVGGGTILHWDGSSWAVSLSRAEGSFGAVWGSGRSDVWVVGGGREPDGDRASLLLHWDGTSWSESYICNPEGNRFSIGWSAYLSDVWGVSGGTIWATGSCKPGGALQPLGYVAQNDHGSAGWRDTPAFELSGQAPELFRELRTIWSSSASDVWAACNDETAGPRYPIPTMLHFDGTTWTPSSQAITVGIFDLGGTTASDVWAVGKAGKRLHYDGTSWTAAP